MACLHPQRQGSQDAKASKGRAEYFLFGKVKHAFSQCKAGRGQRQMRCDAGLKSSWLTDVLK